MTVARSIVGVSSISPHKALGLADGNTEVLGPKLEVEVVALELDVVT